MGELWVNRFACRRAGFTFARPVSGKNMKHCRVVYHLRMNSSNLPNSDRLFGIAAFLISMGTFCVYIYEARLLQKQQYASALPYLELWTSGGPSRFRLLLVNNGVGPAFVRAVRVYHQGKKYEMDHVAFYKQVRNPADTVQLIASNLVPGRVIPAGREIELLVVEDSPQVVGKFWQLFGGDEAEIEIIYASVYEENWRLRGTNNSPQKLED